MTHARLALYHCQSEFWDHASHQSEQQVSAREQIALPSNRLSSGALAFSSLSEVCRLSSPLGEVHMLMYFVTVVLLDHAFSACTGRVCRKDKLGSTCVGNYGMCVGYMLGYMPSIIRLSGAMSSSKSKNMACNPRAKDHSDYVPSVLMFNSCSSERQVVLLSLFPLQSRVSHSICTVTSVSWLFPRTRSRGQA